MTHALYTPLTDSHTRMRETQKIKRRRKKHQW